MGVRIPQDIIEAAHAEARLKLIEERAFQIYLANITNDGGMSQNGLMQHCFKAAKNFTEIAEIERKKENKS